MIGIIENDMRIASVKMRNFEDRVNYKLRIRVVNIKQLGRIVTIVKEKNIFFHIFTLIFFFCFLVNTVIDVWIKNDYDYD